MTPDRIILSIVSALFGLMIGFAIITIDDIKDIVKQMDAKIDEIKKSIDDKNTDCDTSKTIE